MVAGLFRGTGRYYGDNLHPPRHSNPRGFFESAEVNGLNEYILSRYTPPRTKSLGLNFGCDSPVHGQRWLARIPLGVKVEADGKACAAMEKLLSRQPVCFKDPRFCYTLPLWLPYAPGSRIICVFREPASVVASILKECRAAKYLSDFAISVDQAFEVWTLMYKRVLMKMNPDANWLFLEYEDVFDPAALAKIERFTESEVDRDFPTRELRRSSPEHDVPAEAADIYRQLKALAADMR